MQEVPRALFTLYFTILIYAGLIGLFFLLLWIYLSNPFRTMTIVRSVFSSLMVNDQLLLLKNGSLTVHMGRFWRGFGWVKSGAHILKNALLAAKKARGSTVYEIAKEIHKIRFDPSTPFLISGDHFSVYYPRNLGIFYHAVMDQRVAIDEDDWVAREKKYLQSTAYALEAFTRSQALATTIVPIGMRDVTQISIYAYPSDTLYGILYGLRMMMTNEDFERIYPFKVERKFQKHTQEAAHELVDMYGKGIRELYDGYRAKVFDEKTQLIKRNLRLSSALDTKIRSSAFYDNVIFWKTTELMQQLGLLKLDTEWLRDLKRHILQTFWDEDKGYFLDDLSEESLVQRLYASDWVIVMTTGFLRPDRKTELPYFTRCIEYVRTSKLDDPFPLKVLGSPSKANDHFWVRTFVPNYQDNAIWSNLGMQYIKILIATTLATGDSSFRKEALRALDLYAANILKYKGYPELYDSTGAMMEGRFYRSIRQTGWIVDFEHARAFFERNSE